MPLESTPIIRKFKYNGIRLDDPDPNLTPDKVREHYATLYPELHTAVVEGPVLQKGEHVHEFIRSVGTKG